MGEVTERAASPTASPTQLPEVSAQLLSEFLRTHRAEIRAAWEASARLHPLTRQTSSPVLLALVPDLIDRLADAATAGEPTLELLPPERDHAIGPGTPRDGEVELAQVIAEYELLRTAIARVFERRVGPSPQFHALRCVDQAIDDAVTSFAARFTRQLRVETAHTAARLRFLAEATAALAASLNYDETLQRVAQLAVPELADWCVVDLVDERTAELRRVSVAHRDRELSATAQGWALRYPSDWVASRGISEVIRTGEPELVDDIPDERLVSAARDERDLEALRALGLKSYLIVPLVARDRKLGAITLVAASSGRRYGPAELELACELARRAALAVDNARSYFDAQQALRARDRILAIVSHDLRNPLSAISLIVSLLRDEHREGDTAQQLALVQGAVERMQRLIGDMLDTSTIQSGRLTLVRKPLDPTPLVLDAIATHRPLADPRRIALTHELATELRVDGDAGRIAQVLGNLLGNAIKFCRPGDQVRVQALPDRGQVRFVVADTGPGIAAADLPNIFEPYWTSAKDATQGSGLGLYICKGIVEAHGGRIWAESAPGEGTRISFTLPASGQA